MNEEHFTRLAGCDVGWLKPASGDDRWSLSMICCSRVYYVGEAREVWPWGKCDYKCDYESQDERLRGFLEEKRRIRILTGGTEGMVEICGWASNVRMEGVPGPEKWRKPHAPDSWKCNFILQQLRRRNELTEFRFHVTFFSGDTSWNLMDVLPGMWNAIWLVGPAKHVKMLERLLTLSGPLFYFFIDTCSTRCIQHKKNHLFTFVGIPFPVSCNFSALLQAVLINSWIHRGFRKNTTTPSCNFKGLACNATFGLRSQISVIIFGIDPHPNYC